MTPFDKRLQLAQTLKTLNQRLVECHGSAISTAGHCLLLGRHYAESQHVYFSLNPGFARDGSPMDPSSCGEFNVPFRNPEALLRQYVYLHNCERFLNSHPQLSAWFNAQVTSAFLVPWRTKNTNDLYALNRLTSDRMFDSARQLVQLIIRHHNARLLIVVGKSAITLLNDLMVPDRKIDVDHFLGPGGSYQWSCSQACIENREVTVLQIPHFSRANSPAKMQTLAAWLSQKLPLPFPPSS